MIRLGIGSWTFPWAMGFKKNTYTYKRMTVCELLDIAYKEGFGLVQLYNNVDLLSLSEDEISSVKLYADNFNIELEVGGDDFSEEYIRKLSNVAVALDSKTIRVTIPEKTRGVNYKIKEVASIINGYISFFEEKNISLLIENHDRYCSEEYAEIIEKVDSMSLGICFDTANSIGKIERYNKSFSVLKDYIRCCHYKEYSVNRIATNLGFIVEGCCPGMGENISKEFYELVKNLNRDMDFVIEQWIPYQNTIQKTLETEMKWAMEGMKIIKQLN